jgi:hypothetical protein
MRAHDAASCATKSRGARGPTYSTDAHDTLSVRSDDLVFIGPNARKTFVVRPLARHRHASGWILKGPWEGQSAWPHTMDSFCGGDALNAWRVGEGDVN